MADRGTNAKFRQRLADEIARAKAEGISIAEQARGARVDRGQLYEWRDGNADPSGPALGKLADYYGCTMDYLWGRVPTREGIYAGPPQPVVEAINRIIRAADDLEGYTAPGSEWATAASPEAGGDVADAEGLAGALGEAQQADERARRPGRGRGRGGHPA